MLWVDYMVKAALHSRGSAEHWFRYLRKYIDKCGTVFTTADIDNLYGREELTMFQRISLKAAFTEGSHTRKHIIDLNEHGKHDMLSAVRAKIKEAKV